MNMRRCLLSSMVFLAAASALWADAGDPGQILLWGAGARSLGEGKAFTAIADDASAAYWNPAGMVNVSGTEINMTHSILWNDTSFDALTLVYPMVMKRSIGFSFARIASAGFDRRDNVNTLLGSFGTSEMGLSFAFGQMITRQFAVGSALNYLSRSVDSTSSNLIGIDLSGLYQLNPKMNLGFKVSNLLAIPGSDTEDKLPLNLRFGVSRRMFDDRVVMGLDYAMPAQYYFGVETLLKPVFIRFGLNYEEMTVGLGFAFKSFRMDYALAQNTMLGMSHRISFGYRFASTLDKQRTKKADEFFRKADQSISKGLFAKGAVLYEQGLALEETPEKMRRYNRLLNIMEKLGVRDLSLPKGAKATERNIFDASIKAIDDYLNNNPVNASKKAQLVLSMSPDDARMRILMDILRAEGLPADTDELTGEALVAVKLHRSVGYFQDGKFDLAIKECQQVLDIDPNNALAHVRLGSAYYAVGLKDKAIEEWQKALAIDPNNAELQEFLRQATGK